ncbi:SdrD B-like domain-containing protein, partial [Actinosynnema sp. NPDC023658]|uniref:SdrD B-like domain-containing protein n=1 Tax=Actinosynnema sp. NPDC023658 TaxID=3155465 RepID=UPI0033D8C662
VETTTTETTTAEPAEPTTTPPVGTEPSTSEPTVEPTTPEGSPAPEAPADPAEGSVDLTITVTFDQPSYVADETIRARARVTNKGTATATHVQVVSDAVVDSNYWQGFGFGVSIEPGQAAEGTLVARLNSRVDLLTLAATTRSDEPDADPADNTATATVPITYVRGTLKGTVYADYNGNAAKDAGEEFTNLTVTVSGGPAQGTYATVTDSAGRFAFEGLPRGGYLISFAAADWSFPWTNATVDGEDDPDLLFRAAYLLDPVLTASAAFDRQGYRAGDTALLTLTLTNSGAVPVPGITASCSTTGWSHPELGELAPEGPGVSVPAHAARSFDVRMPIDDRTAGQGYVRVDCKFGERQYSNGDVTASAITRISGAIVATVSGQVTLPLGMPPGAQCGCSGPRPGVPVPDLKVYLKDQFTGAVLARATTTGQGGFEFHDVPAGLHNFGVVGPWKITYGGPEFSVSTGDSRSHLVYVVPGPDQADPEPPRPDG